jgi:hypothetical protein
MNALKLTNRARKAHRVPMSGTRQACAAVMAMLGCGLAGGCISVNAPDKPIVIELNINIKQEVVFRLAAGAQNTIEENSVIF